MSYIYSFKEAMDGLRRARVSTGITVLTVAFLLFILGVLGIFSGNAQRFSGLLQSKVDFQVFISNVLTDAEIAALGERLRAIEEVENVAFISKESVALEFQKEFGQELFDILAENPLPSSFTLTLKKDQRIPAKFKQVKSILEKETGIDEVIQSSAELGALNRYVRIANMINIIFLAIVAVGSLFLISNTIRLILIAKRPIIETMKVVGATDAFIRRPFLIEGMIQGLLGGSVAVLLLLLSTKIVEFIWPGLLLITWQQWILVLLLGVCFGLSASLIAVKRFL